MANSGRPLKYDPRADAIRQAIKYDPVENAQKLIEEVGVEITDGEGRTPLFHAVFCQSIPLITWLLGHGANANHQDRTDATALHFAAYNADIEMVELLLKNGADPNIVDVHGNGALWGATHTACLAIATARNYRALELLLKNGANPHHLNKYERSPFQRSEANPLAKQVFEKVAISCRA